MKGQRVVYKTEIKIRGYHLDLYGHVNNARWVELLEEARWRWLDDNLDLGAWDEVGQGIAVVKLEIDYRLPAHMHDRLEFSCHTLRLGGRAAVCRQEVDRLGTGERLLEARVTFLLIDRHSGKSRPLEGEVRQMLARHLAADPQQRSGQAPR